MAVVTNTSSTCSYPIAYAMYKKFDENIDNQEIFDYEVAVIGPNSTLTLTVTNPPCMFQSDAVYGDVLFSFAGGVRYDTRKLDYFQGTGTNYCTLHCLATPTSTPTQTATSTPTSTPTKPAGTATYTPTKTMTPTSTGTPTRTPTATPTPTPTATPKPMCYLIKSPGFWKNYSSSMSYSEFTSILNATPDYSSISVLTALRILGSSTDSYHKLLLSAELNAAWNGDLINTGPGGALGLATYWNSAYPSSSLNGMSVDAINHLAYSTAPSNAGDDLNAYLDYVGSSGEGDTGSACDVTS